MNKVAHLLLSAVLRRRCCMLGAPAANTRRRAGEISINISCQQGAQQPTRRQPLLPRAFQFGQKSLDSILATESIFSIRFDSAI